MDVSPELGSLLHAGLSAFGVPLAKKLWTKIKKYPAINNLLQKLTDITGY